MWHTKRSSMPWSHSGVALLVKGQDWGSGDAGRVNRQVVPSPLLQQGMFEGCQLWTGRHSTSPSLQLGFSISVMNWKPVFAPQMQVKLLSFPEVSVSWQHWCGEKKSYMCCFDCSGLGTKWGGVDFCCVRSVLSLTGCDVTGFIKQTGYKTLLQ